MVITKGAIHYSKILSVFASIVSSSVFNVVLYLLILVYRVLFHGARVISVAIVGNQSYLSGSSRSCQRCARCECTPYSFLIIIIETNQPTDVRREVTVIRIYSFFYLDARATSGTMDCKLISPSIF